jgi:hypothetical protein
MNDSIALLQTSFANFGSRTIVKSGDKLGYYDLPWGGQVVAKSLRTINGWGWKGSDIDARVSLSDINPGAKAGNVVGNVQNGNQSANIVLASDINMPTKSWRIKRWL